MSCQSVLTIAFFVLFCVSVSYGEPKKVDSGGVSTEKKLTEKDKMPISNKVTIPILDLNNNDIRNVLRGIGMQNNVNIYLEPEVKGKISLYLTNISVKDAIEFIIKKSGYSYKVENKIIKVYKEKPKPEPIPEKKIEFTYTSGLLSFDFEDLTIREVVGLFIDSAEVNVIVEGMSSKKISGKLKKMPISRAISILFTSNGYEVKEEEGVYYAFPAATDNKNGRTGGGSRSHFRRMDMTVTGTDSVSFEVRNASINDLVKSIILECGKDLIVYEEIRGSITAKTDSIHMDDALRFLLQNTEYICWRDNGIYFIGSKKMNKKKSTSVIPLKNIRADQKLVGDLMPNDLVKEAVLKYDSEHNSIIVTGSFNDVEAIRDFIETIDKPVPQVLIEALVVDFNVSKIQSYGLSMFLGGKGESEGWDQESYLPGLSLKPGKKRVQKILNNVLKHVGSNRVVTLPENFRMNLEALESNDLVRVNSVPQIATISGNKGTITIGETRYYKLKKETKNAAITTGDAVVGVDERFQSMKFNTILDVTPWVMDDGNVMVEISPEFSIPRSGGEADRPPTTDTRTINSMVRLNNNQTIVLGGLRHSEEIVNRKGIPFLGSIPILGNLFSSRSMSKNETQMMIFLTPHVYYENEGNVNPDDYFSSEIEDALDRFDPERKKEKDAIEKRERSKRRKKRKAGRKKFYKDVGGFFKGFKTRRQERKAKKAETEKVEESTISVETTVTPLKEKK